MRLFSRECKSEMKHELKVLCSCGQSHSHYPGAHMFTGMSEQTHSDSLHTLRRITAGDKTGIGIQRGSLPTGTEAQCPLRSREHCGELKVF